VQCIFNDEKPVAYILLSDPEDIQSFATQGDSNQLAAECRILVGNDLRGQVVVDTEKFNMYLECHGGCDPFDRIWTYVRRGEEEPLQEFPFLLTVGRLRHLVDSGKITLGPAVSDLLRNEAGKWLTAHESRKPSAEAISLAQRFGPVFSLARSISENKDIPAIDQKMKVKVHLLEADDDAGTNQVWHEYTCEVVLSDSLIAQAREAARRFAETPHPLGWVTTWRNVSLFVGDSPEDEKGFRTDKADMEELCLNLQQMYDSLPESPAGAGILQYFVGWDAHIPESKPNTFYHGLCHGLRVSHDVSQLFMRIHRNSREAFLLEQLFEYLAAKAAEAFFDEQITLSAASPFENARPLPGHIAKAIVPPFQLQSQDIEILAGQVDQELIAKVGPLYAKGSKRSGDPPRASVLESGRSAAFYEGVIHAMALSERIMAIYEGNILPMKVSGSLELEAGSHRVCCMAARHWVQAMYGAVN
jgi:hypothetical protein